jgi:hypothetical protein
MAVAEDYLIDFKNTIIYKIYKIIPKENENNMLELLDSIKKNIPEMMIMLKTQNYYSKVFPLSFRKLIMRDYDQYDFQKMTQEELDLLIPSRKIQQEYKRYSAEYSDLKNEVKQRSEALIPQRVIYIFIPLKISKSSSKFIDGYIKKKNEFYKFTETFYKSIMNETIDKYDSFIEKRKSMEKEIADYLIFNFVSPTLAEGIGENTLEQNNRNLIDMVEGSIPVLGVSGNEADGIFDSMIYDEIFIGEKYYSIITLYEEQIRSTKNGTMFYHTMQPVYNLFNKTTIVNNSVLSNSSTNGMLFFISGFSEKVRKDYNMLEQLDEISSDMDVILKVARIEKNQVLAYFNNIQTKYELQRETLYSKYTKGEVNSTQFDLSIKKLKNDLNYVISLNNKIKDEAEDTYTISGYVIHKIQEQNVKTPIVNNFAIKNIEIKQLNPITDEYNLIFDRSIDRYAEIIHTTPLIHYLNINLRFKNVHIINVSDEENMDKMKLSID